MKNLEKYTHTLTSYEQTLLNLIELFPEKKELIEKFQNYLNNNPGIQEKSNFSEIFYIFLENHFIELINNGYIGLFNRLDGFKFRYAREKGLFLNTLNYKKDGERKIKLLSENDKYLKIEYKELLNKLDNSEINPEEDIIILTKNISLEEYIELSELNEEYQFIYIAANVELSNNYSLLVNFRDYSTSDYVSKYISKNSSKQKHSGLAEIAFSIKTLYKDFLESGVSLPIKMDYFDIEEYSKIKKNAIKDERIILKKGLLDIINRPGITQGAKRINKINKLNLDTQKEFDRILEKHIHHYKKLLGNIGNSQPDITFSLGGAVSNNAVLTTLQKLVPNLDEWKTLDFYYEHRTLLHQINNLNLSLKRVSILSPSILTPFDSINYKNHKNKVDINLADIINNSIKFPEKDFYLVIDNTTRLDKKISEYIGIKPDNLHIIITGSLTKHQRGETKHFFGFSAVYSNDNRIKKGIDSYIDDTNGGINKDNILFIPRLGKTEIRRNLDIIEKNRKSFLEGLNVSQEGVPEKIQISMIDSDYYSFLKIDKVKLLEFQNNKKLSDFELGAYNSTSGNEYFKHIINHYGIEYKGNIILSNTDNFIDFDIDEHLDIPFVDTFGLIKTTMIPVGSSVSEYLIGNGSDLTQTFPRISFGIKEDSKKNYEYGIDIGKKYKKWLEENFNLNKKI